jgi:hypothetical protein
MSDEPKKRKRGEARRRQRRRRNIRALDIVGIVVWIGLLTKIFIADWDRWALGLLRPELSWVLDLRWFFPIALLAMLLVLFRASRLGLGISYVISFPLVVFLWKFPKFLIEHRSSYVFFGVLSAATTLVTRGRRLVISFAIACFSALLITLGDTVWLRYTGIAGMFGILAWVLYSTSIDMLRSPAFIQTQEKVVRAVLSMDFIDRLIVPVQPNQLTLKSWKLGDAKAYQASAGHAFLTRTSLAFAAYSLERYRAGPTAVVTNAISAVMLVFQVIAIFAFINFGVFLIDGSNFEYAHEPNGWTFAYYSSAALYFGEISTLAPVEGLAIIVKLANGIVGAVILSTVMLTIFFSYRSSRSATVSAEVVSMLRGKADDVENLSTSQYQLPLHDLEKRLQETNWSALGAARWLARQIPADWENKSRAESAGGRRRD